MLIAGETQQGSIDVVAKKIEEAVKKRGFSVVMVHNMKETLDKKGVGLSQECRIFEICNAKQAKQVLEKDLSLSVMLPCRVALFQEGSAVKLVTMRPTQMIEQFHKPELQPVAVEVEKAIEGMIQDTVRLEETP